MRSERSNVNPGRMVNLRPTLIPGANTDQQSGRIRFAASRFDEIRRPAKAALVFDTYIGRELPLDLIAKAKPCAQRNQTRAGFKLRDILRRKLNLGPRLQDEALGQQQLILCLYARGEVAVCREEGRRVDFEQIGRKALDELAGLVTPATVLRWYRTRSSGSCRTTASSPPRSASGGCRGRRSSRRTGRE